MKNMTNYNVVDFQLPYIILFNSNILYVYKVNNQIIHVAYVYDLYELVDKSKICKRGVIIWGIS